MPAASDLTVIVCPVAGVKAVRALAPVAFWGAPVLSTNGLAKWGVWNSLLTPTMRTALTAVPGVVLYTSDAAANTGSGWAG